MGALRERTKEGLASGPVFQADSAALVGCIERLRLEMRGAAAAMAQTHSASAQHATPGTISTAKCFPDTSLKAKQQPAKEVKLPMLWDYCKMSIGRTEDSHKHA